MMGDGEYDQGAGLLVWARDARVRSADYAAQAARAAETAVAIGEQVDRMIERMAQRNPEHAKHLQAITVTAARQRAVIAEWRRGGAAGRPGGQLPRGAQAGSGAAVSTELAGHPRDMANIPDRDRIVGERQDEVVRGVFAAGLMLQDAAGLTGEPEVRWRIEAAADDLDELVRLIRGALFGSSDRPPARAPGDGPDDLASSAGDC